MKVIKTELLQECSGRKRGKYLITLEVTDYDIDMLEDLATCFCTVDELTELKPEYVTWLKKVFGCFWKLWKRYDRRW